MNFLSEIIAAKQRRVAAAKLHVPLFALKVAARKRRDGAIAHSLRAALSRGQRAKLIAEFKRRSPSKGPIRADADPASLAMHYESGGAAAISVLTEEDYFGGSLDDLRIVRETASCPILRKDFIFDEFQVYESANAGADALLLIVAALDDKTLTRLRTLAEDELGMDALIEVHTPDEMRRAIDCGADIIGVNNRDLTTFGLSLETSIELASMAPANAVLLSESGIGTREDIERLRAAGYQGFLIGETLMRSYDPAQLLRDLVGSPPYELPTVSVKICGITNLDDARAAISAGADMLGFNFYEQSPRFVTPETAGAIIEDIRANTSSGQRPLMIGVFVNAAMEHIFNIAAAVKLDGVQLHGDETTEFCEQLKNHYGQGLVYKAINGSEELDLKTLVEHPADAILIDAFDPQLRGGTGHLANWTMARKASQLLPRIILAGGLSPENVRDAIKSVRPFAVDACSSLEVSPGKKSAKRIREFVDAVRMSTLQPATGAEEN